MISGVSFHAYLDCERVLHMQLLIHVVHAAPESQIPADREAAVGAHLN